MKQDLITGLLACLITIVGCSVLYPLVVWGFAQLLFPWRAQGSLIERPDQTIVGSSLIGQNFTQPGHFHGRPSAVDYKADAAGGSNLSPTNPRLIDLIKESVQKEGGSSNRPLPVDLATRSGSGLDPHITVQSALFQVPRIARARGLKEEEVKSIIARHVDHSGRILGAPERVNVLLLNLDLDHMLEE